METTSFFKQHAVTMVLCASSIIGAFTLSQYKIDQVINDNKNLYNYTRELRKDITIEQRRGDVITGTVRTLERERDESDKILKGVQDALNKNTVAVELLSAKLVVNKA